MLLLSPDPYSRGLFVACIQTIYLFISHNTMNAQSTFEAGLGEASVFEQLIELIERHENEMSQDKIPLGDFYDLVSNFDFAFQKFNTQNEKDPKVIALYNELLKETVGAFIFIFKVTGFNDGAFFHSFKRFILYFIFLLREAGDLESYEDIMANFYDNFPSLNLNYDLTENDRAKARQLIELFELGRLDERHVGEQPYKKIINFIAHFPDQIGVTVEALKIQVNADEFSLKTIQWDDKQAKYLVLDSKFYMKIRIEVDSEGESASKLLEPFFLITSALENIKGNTVTLEYIEKGSLKGELKVIMKDLVAKEETKTVLDVGKEIAVAALTAGTVSYSEVVKNRKEAQNADLEHEKLIREITQMPSNEEVQQDRALDIERKELENDKLRLENVKAQLAIVESLSGLVAKGILSADMLKISINGIQVLLKEKGEIKEIGPDISDIS
jgi:hypothetical protein